MTQRHFQAEILRVESDAASFCILMRARVPRAFRLPITGEGEFELNKGDAVIYVCVIIGAGVGLYLGNAIPGVLIGLGVGYLIKEGITPNNNR